MVSCNDTANNFNSSAVHYFLIDTGFPGINFSSPTPDDASNQTGKSIFVSVNASASLSNVSTFIDFDNSLVGWWRMDDVNQTGEGALVQDYLSLNNGTAKNNSVQTDAGKMGKGFEFDGDGDYIYLSSWTGNISISGTTSFWFKYKE